MSERPKNFERSWRILEYLRRNSDPEHYVTRAELLNDPVMHRYVKGKETFNDAIFHMALAMNCEENGMVKPSEEWKIDYLAFREKYEGRNEAGEEDDMLEEDDEFEQNQKEPRLPIRKLHYRHTFSYEEINMLIEGILFSRTLDTKTAHHLIEKIEEHLTTKFYKKGPKNICTVRETVLADRDQLRENLLLIQRAIDDKVRIRFRFNGYNRNRELEPVRTEKDTVSPYYIVANGGRYYLLACKEMLKDGSPKRHMSIWRVDLMTDMEIPGRDERRKGERALEKKQVEDLPREWSEDFPLHHLNMSFDKPVPIELRIIPSGGKIGESTERHRPDYTFLYDWFGDTFRYERTETEPPYGDIVSVVCSPFGMVNWALQYSDRVEVLRPEAVREQVIEKIKNLSEKYAVDS
ncbi:hypothetical protein LAWASA_2870 [Lawsonibacter asaccharolyticus]|nr:hypothetical protein LAWASA_2870 [Lawsonibacter asaccharolyticus]